MTDWDSVGLERRRVSLLSYNPDWARVYAREEQLLRKTLGDLVVDIQHVGSTAVPGLAAKPIIDIAVAACSFGETNTEQFKSPLTLAGYEYRREERPEEHLFVKGKEERRFCYLHLVEASGKPWQNYLLFRDYLRAHPDAAQEYAQLKAHLAERFPDDRDSYTEGKAQFINRAIERARENC